MFKFVPNHYLYEQKVAHTFDMYEPNFLLIRLTFVYFINHIGFITYN